jgi:hypothetical protein
MCSESDVEHKETASGAFIHTEGVFERASFDVIIYMLLKGTALNLPFPGA